MILLRFIPDTVDTTEHSSEEFVDDGHLTKSWASRQFSPPTERDHYTHLQHGGGGSIVDASRFRLITVGFRFWFLVISCKLDVFLNQNVLSC